MGARTVVEIPEGFVPVQPGKKREEYMMAKLARDILLVKFVGGIHSAAGRRLIARLQPKYQRWLSGLLPPARNRKVYGSLLRLYGGSQPAASN